MSPTQPPSENRCPECGQPIPATSEVCADCAPPEAADPDEVEQPQGQPRTSHILAALLIGVTLYIAVTLVVTGLGIGQTSRRQLTVAIGAAVLLGLSYCLSRMAEAPKGEP